VPATFNGCLNNFMTTAPDATILIVARDAAATIGRAVRSASRQRAYPILLVDDHSSDETMAIARREAPDLIVIRPPHHGHLGFTRQCALDAVRTPFALWLDADDEMLPGRTARMVDALAAADADLAFDELELVDGQSGQLLRRWPIPAFLDSAPFLFRQFERNYLPGVGQVAFRTASARRIGYDPDLHGTEDSDFVLRALIGGLRTTLVRTVGYRMYAYPQSVSRQLDIQRSMYRKALVKHAYADVAAAAAATGATPGSIAWILTSLAIFREEYDAARRFAEEATAHSGDPAAGLEEECPLTVAWRAAFVRGTLDALVGRDASARRHLQEAEAIQQTPEGANNLGVVLGRLGDEAAARGCFRRALSKSSGYTDARLNLSLAAPDRITSHPLRRLAARTDYASAVHTPGFVGQTNHDR